MRKCLAALHRVLEVLLVASLFVLVIPVTLQILSRHTELVPTYLWTEELARFCFVWMIMIGAMLAVRESMHFDVDLLPRLSARGQAAVAILTYLLMGALAVLFLDYGIRFTEFGKDQTSEIAELPMWMIFAAWPLAGFTWIVFLGEKLFDSLRTLLRGA